MRSGPNWSSGGSGIRSSDTGRPRSRPGTGRSGTSRTSSTGGGRPRSTTSSTTTPPIAVKRALPSARVGGPHVAGTKSPRGHEVPPGLPRSLPARQERRHGEEWAHRSTSWRSTPRGTPRFVEGHVQTGIGSQLRDIDRGFEVVASYPELKGKPVIIGESDPDGCAACPSSIYPQNGYRNGTLYASYTAAAFARKYDLAERHGVNFEGAVTWAFEFEGQPYFAGFRVLSTNGIPLPVLNVFRMFGLMGGRRLAVESTGEVGLEEIRRDGVRGRPDVSALASLRDRQGLRAGVAPSR